MREGGVAAAREHRRHVAAENRQSRVADGEHTRVNSVKPAHRDAVAHRGCAQPDLEQLPQRHDAVLHGGTRRDEPVHRAQWFKTLNR